jgi:selT/selW/selH-like putative selenoprotein
LAAEVRQRFPEAEIEMVPSSGGRFEVSYEGQPIFEKSRMKRHAAPGEIIRLLEARRGANA